MKNPVVFDKHIKLYIYSFRCCWLDEARFTVRILSFVILFFIKFVYKIEQIAHVRILSTKKSLKRFLFVDKYLKKKEHLIHLHSTDSLILFVVRMS